MSNNNENEIEKQENLNAQDSVNNEAQLNKDESLEQEKQNNESADEQDEDFDLEDLDEDSTEEEGESESDADEKSIEKQDDEFSEKAINDRKEKAKIEFGKYVELFKNTATEAGANPKLCDAIQDFIEYLVSSSLVELKDDLRFLKRKLTPSSSRPSFKPRTPYAGGGERRPYTPREGGRPPYSGGSERPAYSGGERPAYSGGGERRPYTPREGGNREGNREGGRFSSYGDRDSRPPRREFTGGDRRPPFRGRDDR